MVNPLTRCTEDYSLPPYAVLRASDVAPAVRAAIAEYTLDLNALEDDLCEADLSTLTWESVMDRLEIIDDPLEKLATILKHLTWVANSPELRAACGDVQPDIVEIKSRRAHSDIVFRALQALRASPAYEADFTVEQQLSLDIAAFMPVMKQCSHRPTREVLYRAFMTKASTPPFDNTPIIGEILQLRQAHAHLLGFQSYAELSFQDKMAPSVQVVDDMLCELRDKCLPLSKAELDNVAAFAKQHGHASRLESWDVAFCDVLNLTYTFGHGIRMMLTTADHTAASSVDGIEGDAIEIPSQFLSTFCYRPVLRMMSGHFVTGAPMPDELVDSIVKSRNFMAATELLRQLRLGATDLALHHSYDPYSTTVSAFDVHRSIFASWLKQLHVLPRSPGEEDPIVFIRKCSIGLQGQCLEFIKDV
ncbi:hypothetical protein DYB32_005725 [Aphanomyces invadans]|uniref:Peptidase M3A/M3B catalytic domain-containing protein n=1 Tax=Aphanomyces invadans TaxID=157072 RepID=A0A418ATR5_9STRA|nr:hypothetical protein DYB32_005725 [Aphanomyces invadans]